jgi:protein tyrosine phosphatase (PTP) superfamily phosphohydrolase (DUF442 family)
MKTHYFAAIRGLTLILVAGVVCWPMLLCAQVSPQPSRGEFTQITTELKDLTSATNPTRVIESRTQSARVLLETRTTEARSINGGYAPINVIERETVQMDANTTRVVQRVFAINPDGRRTLFQVTEETRIKRSDGENVERTSSNSDLDGRLHMVQRDVESTRISGSVEETTVTTSKLGANGFAPVLTRRETTERQGPGATHSTSTVSVVGLNGEFLPVQVTDIVQTGSNGVQKRVESISRNNGNGMALVEQNVTTDAQRGEEHHGKLEVYHRHSPGVAPDSQLHLVGQQETERTTLRDGSTRTNVREEQVVPGSQTNEMHLTIRTIEASRSSATGQETVRKIETWDGNQGLRPAWIIDSKGVRRNE